MCGCHFVIEPHSAEIKDADNHFLLLRVVLLVDHFACSGFLGPSGACWIVSCNMLWCCIYEYMHILIIQYMSVLHSSIYFDRFSGPHVRTWTGCISFSFILLPSAQGPVLTMMSGEQCFGSRVDLLCAHPDPFDDPVKYFPSTMSLYM